MGFTPFCCEKCWGKEGDDSIAEELQSEIAVYCRRLNPDARIVSRIGKESNLDAIHRAGADAVPSSNSPPEASS